MKSYIQTIRSSCQAMQPKPTDTAARLSPLPDIRAVLFDIYGTLIISGSGDVGSDRLDHRRNSLVETLNLFDLDLCCDADEATDKFTAAIRMEHEKAKATGVRYPEVDFREIWSAVLPEITNNKVAGFDPADVSAVDISAFALEFELRVNPTWPMPNAEAILDLLHDRGLMLGIVSNAQFFTPLLFDALFDRGLEDLGVSRELTYFSYEHRQAKPGTELYDLAKSKLADLGIAANQVLYVGNDMLNDVTAASQVGFRTALFAGDQRSLRLRIDDDRVHGVEADIVVTELPQLIECLPSTNSK